MARVSHLFYSILADFQAERTDRLCFKRFLKELLKSSELSKYHL
jgi:hypothetical protein